MLLLRALLEHWPDSQVTPEIPDDEAAGIDVIGESGYFLIDCFNWLLCSSSFLFHNFYFLVVCFF